MNPLRISRPDWLIMGAGALVAGVGGWLGAVFHWGGWIGLYGYDWFVLWGRWQPLRVFTWPVGALCPDWRGRRQAPWFSPYRNVYPGPSDRRSEPPGPVTCNGRSGLGHPPCDGGMAIW